MNPADFFLLLLSLTFASIALFANGWTMSGIGPALLAASGGLWQLGMQRLRHRSWLQHRDSGIAPGTQNLAFVGAVGWFAAMAGAVVWAVVSLKGQ
jgi:hypothetical protein